MSKPFQHRALLLQEEKEIVYTAMSKHLFYLRMQISRFVLEEGKVPLNPFMLFDYFLLDSIDRDRIREANNVILRKADAVWVFGPISDGVLAEILLARSWGKSIRYFVFETNRFQEIEAVDVLMEEEVKDQQFSLSP